MGSLSADQRRGLIGHLVAEAAGRQHDSKCSGAAVSRRSSCRSTAMTSSLYSKRSLTSSRGRWTSGVSSSGRIRAMKMSREEFERRKAEGAESNRLFEERVARMKAE